MKAEVVRCSSLKARILMFLGFAAIWAAPPIVCQNPGVRERREIRIPSSGGEQALVLQISTERNRGVVSVRDERGSEVQKLICPLLRDNTAASPDELAAVREQFLTTIYGAGLRF